ncbi:hypothetical protein BDV96DRAFT_655706 [Lophiotrema nucula]|uniref:BTB domain-containing protein n=1 Tax=Lophiotrema nucula TaxID=690887 RepID=A0A6A5YE69_9PLEO|nr:hypothetical protein BDV96DRAFT_655706 [Lophiotrema nucula]
MFPLYKKEPELMVRPLPHQPTFVMMENENRFEAQEQHAEILRVPSESTPLVDQFPLPPNSNGLQGAQLVQPSPHDHRVGNNVLPYTPVVNFVAKGPLTLTPKGPLTLVVGSKDNGNGPRKYKVSYEAVSRLSPVLKKLLEDNCSKFPGRSIKIKLKWEDPDMLALILRIAHANLLPVWHATLDFRQLLEMALLCHQYDLNPLLSPFIDKWIAPFAGRVLEPGFEDWLFIAYQFGLEDDYRALSRYLTLNCTISERKQALSPSGKPLNGSYPPGSLEHIYGLRERILKEFLDTVYYHVESMLDGNTCQCTTATPQNANECTLLNHGSTVRSLKALGYYPHLPSTRHLSASITAIQAQLTGIKVMTWRHTDGSANGEDAREESDPHWGCNSGRILAGRIRDVVARLEGGVDEGVVKGLRNNGGKLRGVRR